ncbi:MAG: glycerophosphodiester phosphodiesterase [Gammaproteobacteria bacterium]|nr:glycerophosphodiester phosphodiesterase [Gammaproteobacteria bacterium]
MSIDLQGHRGARGLAPENSLPAFEMALKIGVTTLEMDVAITRDGVVVVSHDLSLNPDITRDNRGRWIDEPGPALYQLTLAEVQRYDIGRINPKSEYAAEFPSQLAIDQTYIPTLVEVAALTKELGNDTVGFNIETKIKPCEPELTPPPEILADALIEVLHAAEIADRTTLQSFDWRTLQRAQEIAPHIPTVYLSAQQDWYDNIKADKSEISPWTAGFDIKKFNGSLASLINTVGGSIWSPYYREVTRKNVDEAHQNSLGVVVWTVNDPGDVEKMIDLGVDGIISDYPDMGRQVLEQNRIHLSSYAPRQHAWHGT